MMKIRTAAVLIVLLSPLPAWATCETPMAVQGALQSTSAQQATDVQTMTAARITGAEVDIPGAQTAVNGALEDMERAIVSKLEAFRQQWIEALEDMSDQMVAVVIDQSEAAAKTEDGDLTAKAAQMVEKEKLDGKDDNENAEETSCTFDTTAKSIAETDAISDAMMVGYALDFNKIGNSNKNSPAAGGAATLQKARWEIYKTAFCDPAKNNGAAGCPTPTPGAGAQISPSQTLFAKPTLDLDDVTARQAVTELMFNITGYRPAEIIPRTALKSAVGVQQRQENREYTTQMDAVGAMLFGAAADRAPGPEAPDVQALRKKAGILDASLTPSRREVRQATLEHITSPAFLQDLYKKDAPLTQIELYVKARNVSLLYALLEKEERIANAEAIDTANLLDKLSGGRGSSAAAVPFNRGASP